MFLPSAVRIFFVSCSTDNNFMKPVNVGYALIDYTIDLKKRLSCRKYRF